MVGEDVPLLGRKDVVLASCGWCKGRHHRLPQEQRIMSKVVVRVNVRANLRWLGVLIVILVVIKNIIIC